MTRHALKWLNKPGGESSRAKERISSWLSGRLLKIRIMDSYSCYTYGSLSQPTDKDPPQGFVGATTVLGDWVASALHLSHGLACSL